MSDSKRSISVALCTFNGARYLQEQLDSIAVQTLLPAELVVNDDGSSDRTVEIVNYFAETAPFPVRLQWNSATLGSVANFADAIARCRGEYVALADQDDIWKPNKLEVLLSCIGEASLVFSDAFLTRDANLESGTLFSTLGFNRSARKQFKANPFAYLLRHTVVSGATILLHRAIIPAVLPVPPISRALWDHDGWIALVAAAIAEVRICPEALMEYRQHPSQQIGLRPRDPLLSRNRWKNAADFRRQGLQGALSDHRFLLQRLMAVQKLDASVQRQVEQKIAFLEQRLSLSEHRMTRISTAVKLLLRGDYHRFASGCSGAVGDVLLS